MDDEKTPQDHKNEAEKETATKKADDRKRRWDDEIERSGHEYQPTPETQKRRDAEIKRDEDESNEE